MTSENLKKMIRRKELVRLGNEEALQEADEIAAAVERAGGLTNLEVYALWGHTCKPTAEEIAAAERRREERAALALNPSPNLIAMRRHDELLKLGTEEAQREAEQILRAIVRAGGITGAEAQVLLSGD
ncbi:MAG: hypothetical protein O3B27_10595 [Actinomycetota bacterium]|nr:hypothetical protein [Actinomycetota bacterium]MDA2949512.1 hypothetical protein [Actinomycetota bacterium]MDA2991992.1 hypothetical protein [Actinomycetota bacterium]